LASKIINRLHHFLIKKFDECWAPDDQNNTLAGELSFCDNLGNVKYIGPISRLERQENPELKYDIIVVLSGPEPQRTLLESLLFKQIENTAYKVYFVRGSNIPPLYNNKHKSVEVINVLNSETLNDKIEQSNIVICRSGYTSIMDLIKLQKKAILIPTPGQTEQEYLATFHHERGTFLSYTQKDFKLTTALKAADSFEWNFPKVNMEHYKLAIENLVETKLSGKL
ncbi:MAG: glycosyltransferase, partial [Ginsengibacter sp.]